MSTTTREEFLAHCHHARVVPVIRELFADALTPVALYRSLAEGRPGSFLLESADQGGIWSRYSFIGVRSFGVLTEQEGRAAWIDTGVSVHRAFGAELPEQTLDALDALYLRWRSPEANGHPPLTGGLVGFIGWDTVRQVEHLPNAPVADVECPELALAFVSELLVMDHRSGTVSVVVSVINDGVDEPAELWDDAQRRLDLLATDMARAVAPDVAVIDMGAIAHPRHRTVRDDFLAAVDASQRAIRDGDVFQVVISQRFDQEVHATALDVYRVLRALNPSPYMYTLTLQTVDGEPYAIVGSSPEALVKASAGRAYMHPIAGSRPRGDSPEADSELADELLADRKEQAEHLMLVDLGRNDLSKVCRPGTVEVTEFMQVERFSHIMHLVSSVEGDLRDDVTPIDVFRATFPAGTLSGAPKPRALQIIDELEPTRRGVYGGVVGYIAFSGDLDLAIAIRTAVLRGTTAHVQAGAGLVADSVAESEYDETVAKAAAPLRAVAIANALRNISS